MFRTKRLVRAVRDRFAGVHGRLTATLLLVCVLMAGLGVFMLAQMSRVGATTRDLEAAIPGVIALGEINSSRSDLRTAELQHILSSTSEQQDKWEELMATQMERIEKNQAVYEPLIHSAEERATYDQFVAFWADYIVDRMETLALSRAHDTAGATKRLEVRSIRESSQSVSRIVETIDEIAFQTNILALNAAVERRARAPRVTASPLLPTKFAASRSGQRRRLTRRQRSSRSRSGPRPKAAGAWMSSRRGSKASRRASIA